MKATPHVTADFEEYPELRIVADVALRRIVELMEMHDIAEMRRVRKTGVFNHSYDKDVITPIGVPHVPNTVAAARYSAGKAMLDYLETIGISGISMEFSKEDVMAVDELWLPKKPAEVHAGTLDPKPVGETQKAKPNKVNADNEASNTSEASTAGEADEQSPAGVAMETGDNKEEK